MTTVHLGNGIHLTEKNGQLNVNFDQVFNSAKQSLRNKHVNSTKTVALNKTPSINKKSQEKPKHPPNNRPPKAPIVKKIAKEETVTLTKAQLDTLLSTINDVCEAVGKSSPLDAVKETQEMKNDEEPQDPEEKIASRHHKMSKSKNVENINRLANRPSTDQYFSDSEDEDPRRTKQRRTRSKKPVVPAITHRDAFNNRLVSKAVSPIVVYDLKKSEDRPKVKKTKSDKPIKSTTSKKSSNAILTLLDNEKNISSAEPSIVRTPSPEVMANNVSLSPVNAVPPTHLSLGEKKRLQWQREIEQQKSLFAESSRVTSFPNIPNQSFSQLKNAEDTRDSPRRFIENPSAMVDHFHFEEEEAHKQAKKLEQRAWINELASQRHEQLIKKELNSQLRKNKSGLISLLSKDFERSVIEKVRHIEEPDLIRQQIGNIIRSHVATHEIKHTVSHPQISKQLPQRIQTPKQPSPNKIDLVQSTPRAIDPATARSLELDESAPTAYNSSQANQILKPTNSATYIATSHDRNFGRLKALIDPAEVERLEIQRRKEEEHQRIIQEQVELKKKQKEELRLKKIREDLEDEIRYRKHLELINGRNENEEEAKQKKIAEEQAKQERMIERIKLAEEKIRQEKLAAKKTVASHTLGHTELDPDSSSAPPPKSIASPEEPSIHQLMREDSDANVEYVDSPSAQTVSAKYVDTVTSRNSPIKQKPTQESYRNQMKVKKDAALKKHNQSINNRRKPQAKDKLYQPSPPVPALQSKGMSKPAIPVSRATNGPSGRQTRLTEVAQRNPSRFVEMTPSELPPQGGDFVPFRRTSAVIDPAIESQRQNPTYQRHVEEENFSQKQDAILKHLSTLRSGLLEKQREYQMVSTPT